MRLINYEVQPKLPDTIYEVREYKLLTPRVAQVFLSAKSGSPLQYEAGQYIKLVHPDGSTSPFSIANAPQVSSNLELHLLFLKENRKACDIFQHVKEKKELRLRGPYGHCTLSHMQPDKPIIFIARGTGFSPVKAVIEALALQSSCPPIHFYWSAPGWRDLYLRELIDRWLRQLRDFRFTAVLTREYLPFPEEVKYGSASELVLQDYPDLSAHQVYMSGPQRMVYSTFEAFQERGLVREHFYSDVFDYSPE